MVTKTPNPKTTKSKTKPKRKPRGWVAYTFGSSDNDQFPYHLYRTKQSAEYDLKPLRFFFGGRVIKVKVMEVIE